MNAVFWGFLIPFIGTASGSACVFLLKKELKAGIQRALTGFAAGVMVAASIWSLIVPAIEQSSDKGSWAFLPPLSDSGWASCSCCFWIISFPTCTGALTTRIRWRDLNPD